MRVQATPERAIDGAKLADEIIAALAEVTGEHATRRRREQLRVSETFSAAHRGGVGSPLVCLHGFTDTWRTWELVLPALERQHDVFAPTLPGHAGGPPLTDGTEAAVVDSLEQMLDEAGIESAHIAGNSLGGYLALQLAARGRARSVVALAPAGGWAAGDETYKDTLEHFPRMQELAKASLPHIDAIVSSPAGRRRATEFITTNYEHIPPELIAHQVHGVASCTAVQPMTVAALENSWTLDAQRITCPVRVVWGTDDRLLPWPTAATRYREDWLPHADWIELEGVGHCPQLDVPLETAELIAGFTGLIRVRGVLSTHHLPEFLLTVYVLILIPGPSVLFVVSRGVALGRRAALATVLGNAMGFALQLTLVAIGIGSLVAHSEAVFTALKLAGAAYLVYLGIRNIRDRKALARIFGTTEVAPKSLRRIVREGFVVGATNPKGVIIFTAVLPQFIDRSAGHVTLQLLTLGAICLVIALLSDGAWAIASGTARQWLGRSSRRLELLSATGGAMLVGLGVALAVTGRKQ